MQSKGFKGVALARRRSVYRLRGRKRRCKIGDGDTVVDVLRHRSGHQCNTKLVDNG